MCRSALNLRLGKVQIVRPGHRLEICQTESCKTQRVEGAMIKSVQDGYLLGGAMEGPPCARRGIRAP